MHILVGNDLDVPICNERLTSGDLQRILIRLIYDCNCIPCICIMYLRYQRFLSRLFRLWHCLPFPIQIMCSIILLYLRNLLKPLNFNAASVTLGWGEM